MSKVKPSKLLKNAQLWTTKHSPEILVGLGITGMITTTVLAVKATPKALMLIEEKKKEEQVESLTAFETVKTTWKCYIPAAISGVVSASCIIGANSVNSRRNAALAAAYKLSETAFTEYREKVVETIGDKKEKDVRDKVAKSRVENNPVTKSEVIVTERGNTLCYDYYSGRYFNSDIDKIKKAVNEINRRLISEDYISLTEFYSELGLSPTKVSDEIGWNLDDGLIEVYFSSQLADDGRPCIVVDYENPPRHGFSKFA